MNKELELRSYSFEVEASEEDRGKTISGRAVVYNSVTDLGQFDEVIEGGALDGADLKDVRFLVNHDKKQIPLARSRRNNGKSTMQLEIDDDGLSFWAVLDVENNAEARALYSAVERGDVSGMSFMFSVEADAWENLNSEHPLRRILKIGSIVEISAVTFPAYDSTEIFARSREALEKARASVETESSLAKTELENSAELELLKEKIKILGGF